MAIGHHGDNWTNKPSQACILGVGLICLLHNADLPEQTNSVRRDGMVWCLSAQYIIVIII